MNTNKINFADFLEAKIRKETKTSNVAKVVQVFTDTKGDPTKPKSLEEASQEWAVLKYKESQNVKDFDANNKDHIQTLSGYVQEGAKHIKRAWRDEMNQNSISYNPKYKNRFTCHVNEEGLYSITLIGHEPK